MFSMVEITQLSNQDSPSAQIPLPQNLPRYLEIEMLEDLDGLDTDSALDLLTDRLYDLNLVLATQRMTHRRKKMLDTFFTFLCDLHDLCLDFDGFLHLK